MKSPYLIFVRLISQLVGGEYPEHYSSSIKKRIRLLWIIGIPLLVGVAHTNMNRIQMSRGLFSGSVETELFNMALLILLIATGVLSWKLAGQRSESIRQHILQTNVGVIVTKDTLHTAKDTLKLYGFLKTYAFLTFLFSIDLFLELIIQQKLEILVYLQYAFLLPSLYYMILLLDLLFPILSRWGRQYISNDNSIQTNSETNSEN